MSLYGQTPNFGFNLIAFDAPNWQQLEYENWRKIDGLFADLGATPTYANDTGAADVYVVNPSTPVEAYSASLQVAFRAANANTGPSTVNVSGLGAKDIYAQGAPLSAGMIPQNAYVKLIYDGIRFHLLEPRVVDVNIADGSLGYEKLTEGAPTWDPSGLLSAESAAITGEMSAGSLKEGDRKGISHFSNAYTSGKVTFSTADPTGGNNGDIWFKYTP